jgi:hypothetical protein
VRTSERASEKARAHLSEGRMAARADPEVPPRVAQRGDLGAIARGREQGGGGGAAGVGLDHRRGRRGEGEGVGGE